MVELHIDDIFEYVEHDGTKYLRLLSTYGGNTSICIPAGKKAMITFGQDEAIFRSSQLNK